MSSPPIAIEEFPSAMVSAPMAIAWVPFAQAPLPCEDPIAIDCPTELVDPLSPTLVFAPIVILLCEAPPGVQFSCPALYPIATPYWFVDDSTPTATAPSFPVAWAFLPTATPPAVEFDCVPTATAFPLPLPLALTP